MNIKNLFDNWNTKDTKVTSSSDSPKIGKKIIMGAVAISLGVAMFATYDHVNNQTENQLFDKLGSSYQFNDGEVLKGQTLNTILDRIDSGFKYSLSTDKNQYQMAGNIIDYENIDKTKEYYNTLDIDTTHVNACEVNINKTQFTMFKKISPLLSDKQLHTFLYLHEQAHCADMARMFEDVKEYRDDIARTQLSGGYFDTNRVILTESYADSYALLIMAVKNPEASEKYFKSIKDFRIRDKIEGIDSFPNDKKDKRYNHDTVNTLDMTYEAITKLDMSRLNKLMDTKEGSLIVEKELSKIAATSASVGYKMWVSEEGYSSKGKAFKGGMDKYSEYGDLEFDNIETYKDNHAKVIEKTNSFLAKNKDGLSTIQALRLQFNPNQQVANKNKIN